MRCSPIRESFAAPPHDNLTGTLLSSSEKRPPPEISRIWLDRSHLANSPVMMNPRIVITGGSGFLGRWTVRAARNRWDVTATYLTNPQTKPGVNWRQLDVRDRSAVFTLIKGARPSAVVHTAALNPGQGSSFEAVNVDGTRHVAQASALAGAHLVHVHVSTDVLFDGRRGNYVEEDPPSPITPYGRSKALAEQEVREACGSACIVRTSLIYGASADPERPSLRETPWPHWDRQTRWVIGDLMAGKTVDLFTDEMRCPVWVKSLASALIEVAESGSGSDPGTDVLHVAGAQALSRFEFGWRLACFHGIDPAGIMPAKSREMDVNRPLNCTLDCSRARALLRTPLPGVDEVLGSPAASPDVQS